MKKSGLVLILILMLLLTGCIDKYELTDKQTDIEAEYMAGMLLKYDKNYNESLVSEDKVSDKKEDASSTGQDTAATPAPSPAAQENSVQNLSNEDNSTQGISTKDNYTTAQVIGTQDFDIQYNGYKLYDEYPEDKTSSYFSLTPSEGDQLLVASFKLKNVTNEEKRLDLKKSKISYQLDINVGTVYKPLFTLLENDLRYLDMTVGAGKEKTVLLVFEISKNIDLKNVNLIISKNDKTEIIEIK